jgi:hypothetical protein
VLMHHNGQSRRAGGSGLNDHWLPRIAIAFCDLTADWLNAHGKDDNRHIAIGHCTISPYGNVVKWLDVRRA